MTRSFSEMVVAGLFSVRGCGGCVLMVLMIAFPCSLTVRAQGQTGASTDAAGSAQTNEGLQQRVGELEGEVAELKRIVKELQSNSQAAGGPQDPPSTRLTAGAQPVSAEQVDAHDTRQKEPRLSARHNHQHWDGRLLRIQLQCSRRASQSVDGPMTCSATVSA